MANGLVQVPPDSTGKKVDASSLDVGVDTVYRQRFVLGSDTGTATFAAVLSSGPAGTEGGLIVRNIPSGTQTIGGTLDAISATVTIAGAVSLTTAVNVSAMPALTGTFNISGTPSVVLAVGAANIGTINNISATVIVAGEIANGASLSTTNKPVLIGGNTSAGGAGGLAATLLLDTTGAVKLGAGTNNIGAVSNAAGTALMGAVSLAAGTANIGFINNISATVLVAGTVSLGAGTTNIGGVSLVAGTANIGFINNISATVIVAGIVSLGAGTNLIGAVSIAAGTALMGGVSLVAGTANIGFINNISANVKVVGTVAPGGSITAGDAPVQIGMRANLSAPAALNSAQAVNAWADKFGRQIVQLNHPSLLPTASHGPKCVTLSTSATVALVAAPGAGLSVFITKIACTNGSATLTKGRVYAASATASCICEMFMAASGGGFVMDYNPPIQILSNTALNAAVKPNVSQCIFNVHFYVGAK